MFALVDCNNFYVSCERLFRPELEGKPVVVLSNNDGCIISRSQEAKDLGIKMGTPAFMVDGELKKHGIIAFSSNYALYGDISRRVMETIRSFVEETEVYSIDEAFANLTLYPKEQLTGLGLKIRAAVQQNIGIPVGVGIAPTKTLAKLANKYAKKNLKGRAVFAANSAEKVETILKWADISDVWGIGRQHEKMLRENGYKTAYDLISASEAWILDKMTVVGHRLIKELKGVPCYEMLERPPLKKMITCARGYGETLTKKEDIQAATASYAALVGEKLRREGLCAKVINVFIMTNEHRLQDKQYARDIDIQLPVATNDTAELIKYVMRGIDLLYRQGYNFKKSGVIASGLVPQTSVQGSLFNHRNREKHGRLMAALDNINVAYGKDTLRYAVQHFTDKWRLRTARLSPNYTSWNEMYQIT